MGFFKKAEKGSYDLFSNYSHFVPGMGGLLMILVMFLAGGLLANILQIGLMAISTEFANTYGQMLSYPLLFIPAMLYASAQSRKNEIFDKGYALDSNNFSPLNGWKAGLLAAISTLALAFIVEPLMVFLPEMPLWFKDLMEKMLTGTPFWVTLISVSVFAPIFEEWLCRGIILRGLLSKMSPTGAITISALFFAVIHLNPWQALPAFILGMWFGYVYYKTGSLKLTMLMHFANNTMAACMGQIPELSEADSVMEIMPVWQFTSVYALAIIVFAIAALSFRKVELKGSGAGNCDEIPAIDAE